MGSGREGQPTPEEAMNWRAPDSENAAGDPPAVPDNEIGLDFVRSSGPGGQNVNKVASKAVLRWNVGASSAFTEEQKEKIRAAAGNRLSKADEIVIASQVERSQAQNREEVIVRLQRLVAEALMPKKERVATKPTRSSKERRLEEKRKQGQKKDRRKKVDW